MLETKNLKKVYKTKKGVSVNALNGVSIKFPEKGLVFLLGKSGSGKSTLLNLLGGLDKYDEGEIIIKGVSSKDFNQSHFDSYRNTYVGFIFQEYNVLEEFTVGANIALAIELQGRKASDEEINSILTKVDLEGYGDRKPNELSGGQKQRVAIARALVKNPQIIMADEPTGALDSKTGKQVLDTLKKLSEEKLVIVVSHDREFAETYGDRIIELADGNIIEDMEKSVKIVAKQRKINEDNLQFNDTTVVVKKGYHLTEDDRVKINEYIDRFNSNLNIKVANENQGGSTGEFVKTDESKIKYQDREFKLIKSKLPLKNAFKIGASSLKHKKIRLTITILLSFVAFTLFALADTFGNYNHIKTCTKSIVDSKIKYATVSKSIKVGDGTYSYWNEYGNYLSKGDLKKINKETGLNFTGVITPNEELTLGNIDTNIKLTKNDSYCAYANSVSGFTTLDNNKLKEYNYKMIAGKLPEGKNNDIALSEYVFETFKKAGYVNGNKTIKINDYNDLVGKEIAIGKSKYKVVGIFDTQVDLNRYKDLSGDLKGNSSAENLALYALGNELGKIQQYSLSSVAVVSSEKFAEIKNDVPNFVQMMNSYLNVFDDKASVDGEYIGTIDDIDLNDVTWLDGKKDKLANNEIIVDIKSFTFDENHETTLKEKLEYLKTHTFTVYTGDDENTKDLEKCKVVGVLDYGKGEDKYQGVYIVPENIFGYSEEWTKGKGDYDFAVTAMPKKTSDIEDIVKYCYTIRDGVKYQMQNSVTYELDTVDEILKVMSKVFFYVGLGFALFAMIMLSNFIATSISYKKQEIGILRAIGARSNDVFRIFFAESFVIAMVNFVLACTATGVGTAILNGLFRSRVGILITVLNFGIRQIALLFIISIGVAAVASFIPVYRIASKKPIEAIRNK
ncbi:MAG: ATP-binding cassette domain-containing protein [Eubacterium sp.]